jgi:hypothetical protein
MWIAHMERECGSVDVMAGIGSRVAGIAAGKVATKAATETWRTATLEDPPDQVQAPLLKVVLWSALIGAAMSVTRALVTRALEKR